MRTWNPRKPLVVKPSELLCFKDTINFTALLLFLSGINRQCIWVKYFELNSMTWPIKSLTSLIGIKIYGKYQWIKKFDKHLYPMLNISYAVKKIYKNFAWLFLLIELVKMSQKREKLKIKTLIFEQKNNCLQKIKKGTSKVALC